MRCVQVTVLGLLVGGVLSAMPALAGPWAREAGDFFGSLRISAEEAPSDVIAGLWEPETYLSAYGEVGLGHSLTLGADIGSGEVSTLAVVFLRYTLTAPEDTWQLAVDGGLGRRQVGEEDGRTLVRLGASVGRGWGEGGGGVWYMPLNHDGGWGVLDGAIYYDLDTSETIWQLEGTLGLRVAERVSTTLSLKVEDYPDADLLVTASPTVIYDITDATAVRFGVTGALTGSDALGVSLAVLFEF